MSTAFANIKWGRIAVASVTVFSVTFCLLFALITAYAFILGFQARGMPNPVLIGQFANQVGTVGGPVLAMLLTVGGSAWVARRVETQPQLHGLLVGLTIAIIGLIFSRSFDLAALVKFTLPIIGSWLGSLWGSRGQRYQIARPTSE